MPGSCASPVGSRFVIVPTPHMADTGVCLSARRSEGVRQIFEAFSPLAAFDVVREARENVCLVSHDLCEAGQVFPTEARIAEIRRGAREGATCPSCPSGRAVD